MHLLPLSLGSFFCRVDWMVCMSRLNSALMASLLLVVSVGACSERPEQSVRLSPEASSRAGLDDGLAGVWVGTLTGPVDSSGVRFEITESNGQLTGVTFYTEPSSSEYMRMGALSGSRTGTTAQWTTGNNSVSGTLNGDTFSGTFVFGSVDTDPALTVQLSLQRSSCVPESDASFCSRNGFDCGLAVGGDNCSVRRMVSSCGTCGAGLSCNQQNKCQ
ncbi:hypothetical protein [Vitiosangium sp. GDMCC 1.1324]|uniref:hypothetical protein n=1 Tax=Vitiosangium sp. (strain GDMCC 1.1324) TaxID=2138576 RepID=UPI0011B501B9|nr:hypothetical protein [Vitiosangium sp. GDMCC 1.1324]